VEVDASAELLMITHQYEEYKPVRQVWTWLAVVLLAAVTLGWAMVTHMAVPDVARHWDFDVLPDTPGISPYSTLLPPEVSPVPPQIDLPEESIRIKKAPASAISNRKSQISALPPSRDG
jgi:hypothetical protein